MNITPVDTAIHQDLFSVAGTFIAPDAEMEFTTPVGTVTVKPDYVEPHLALVVSLPVSLPVGNATLRMVSPTVSPGNSVPVTIGTGTPQPVRLLQPGEAKAQPYTIVFVANPAIESASGGNFSADPILMNRGGFQRVIGHSFQNLFNVTENLLRQNDFHKRVRIFSIFDPSRPADAANSLAHEILPNLMETRRNVLVPFLSNFGINADMVFVVHGSQTFTRATAWFTTDEPSLAGTAYTFDGAARVHGHFPQIPGSAAIPVSIDTSGLTIIHEFGHAASDFRNGKVTDLYNDGGNGSGFQINKKFRSLSSQPVPTGFASYNGINYNSDPNRDHLNYPTNWLSYHPELIDTTNPNLMDNYWQTSDPQDCRFDKLTFEWFRDRLNAKLTR